MHGFIVNAAGSVTLLKIKAYSKNMRLTTLFFFSMQALSYKNFTAHFWVAVRPLSLLLPFPHSAAFSYKAHASYCAVSSSFSGEFKFSLVQTGFVWFV